MWAELEGPADTTRAATWQEAAQTAVSGLIICLLILGGLRGGGMTGGAPN